MDQVKRCCPLSACSTIAFEAAHFQLKRKLGETFSINLFIRSAVRRRKRIFYRRKQFVEQALKIGPLMLKRCKDVQARVDMVTSVLKTRSYFSKHVKNYHCHTSSCTFDINGPCEQIVMIDSGAGISLGQLTAIFVDLDNLCGVVQIKVVFSMTAFRRNLRERLTNLESSVDVIEMDLEMDEVLEILESLDDADFVVGSLKHDLVEVDVKNLVAPCILRVVGVLNFVSELC